MQKMELITKIVKIDRDLEVITIIQEETVKIRLAINLTVGIITMEKISLLMMELMDIKMLLQTIALLTSKTTHFKNKLDNTTFLRSNQSLNIEFYMTTDKDMS